MPSASELLQHYLDKSAIEYCRTGPQEWVLSLVGSAQQTIQIQVALGDYTITLTSFFMRAPKDNLPETYYLLLRKNLEMQGVRFGLNECGDIFLKAELPVGQLDEETLDRALGSLVQYSDQSYLAVLRLGWASEL